MVAVAALPAGLRRVIERQPAFFQIKLVFEFTQHLFAGALLAAQGLEYLCFALGQPQPADEGAQREALHSSDNRMTMKVSSVGLNYRKAAPVGTASGRARFSPSLTACRRALCALQG